EPLASTGNALARGSRRYRPRYRSPSSTVGLRPYPCTWAGAGAMQYLSPLRQDSRVQSSYSGSVCPPLSRSGSRARRSPFMRATLLPGLLAGSLGLLLCVARPGRGDEVPAEYRAAIQKGLEWLAKNQHKDGHWAELGEQYPMTMTALGGMAMLMEGSTIREGKYKDHIRP